MTSNIFNSLIHWLRNIFTIHLKSIYKKKEAKVLPERKPVEVIRSPKEASIKVVPAGDIPKQVSQPEEKTVEVIRSSEEASIKVVPAGDIPKQVSQPEEKTMKLPPPREETSNITQFPEKNPSKILSIGGPDLAILQQEKLQEVINDISQAQSGEKILTRERLHGAELSPTIKEIEIEPKMKYPTEEKIIHKEEKDTSKPRKPYKRKVPTEERKKEQTKPLTPETKKIGSEKRGPIYLGSTQKRKRRLTGVQQKSPRDENNKTEIVDRPSEEKEIATIVESPFIEIDLDSAEVYLVLPKQQFKANAVEETLHRVSYMLNLDGKQQEVSVRITNNEGGIMFVEEKRISLKEPLLKLQVAFPDEIQGREYNYNHNDKGLYVFGAIGSNRGRMYYIYDKEGKIIDFPKREVWILLNEDFEVQAEPDVIEERWIWERYQPFRIDLSEIDALVIKNRRSGEEKRFALQSPFCVKGEQLVEDDYKKDCPLFTGKTLKILAPYENQSGWSAWIQNKAAGYKFKENWTGREPLALRLPEDLPCEFGEFQIDICQQNTRIPDETLFFRLMPCIELNYPKKLIIPDPKSGYISLTIGIRLDSNDEWGLEYRGIKVKPKQHNLYEIELPPEEDTFRFTLAKTSSPESIVNLQTTVPRLKWKTSEQITWDGTYQKIERRHLAPGYPLKFQIRTNDLGNKYDLLAVLEANAQKLQEGKFIRKGLEYSLELNQFFDTIKQNEEELILRVEIRTMKDLCLLGSIEPLCFEGEARDLEKIQSLKPIERNHKRSYVQAQVKCPGKVPKRRKRIGKGFSAKEILGAGINLKDVRRLHIPYDKRRKSLRPWNINTLKEDMRIMAGENKHAT